MNYKYYFLLTSLLFCLFSIGTGMAQIYKYQDAQGNWYFTDSPERIPKDARKINGENSGAAQTADLKKELYERFSPRNRIEEATLGTVTIKTPAGSGSGFFVTEEGHILTNRHVIRPDVGMKEKAASHYEILDKKAEQISKNFAAEDARLRSMQESLERVKNLAEAE